MRGKSGRVNLVSILRGWLEVAFGVLSFAGLVYLLIGRFEISIAVAEYLFWVQYFAVRATLSGLMIYAGIVSARGNALALFGLNLGIGFASVFLGVTNILEYSLAKGDWKDLLSAVLYLPYGIAILLITLYLKAKTSTGLKSAPDN